MAAVETAVLHGAFAEARVPPAGFDGVLVRLADLNPAEAGGAREGEEQGSRIAAVPLRLVTDASVEALAEALRARFGPRPLDCVVLDQPVSLHDDWRRNNVDHQSRLLAAWNTLSGLMDLGATRALGIANAGEDVIDLLLERSSIAPAANQIELHPYLNSPAIIDHCRDRGIAVHALHCLGPLDGAPKRVLDDPAAAELARAHGRTPAEIVLKWCLGRVDGVVLDDASRALVQSPQAVCDFDLQPEDLEPLDRLHCGYRVDRSASTLASIYGNLSAEPMWVRPTETGSLEVGCHKVLYAPLTRSETFNRRFSFLVWRDLFNLPATVKHAARRRRRVSVLSERIAADLDRDGYSVTNVSELGCEENYRLLSARAATFAKTPAATRHGLRDAELGREIAVADELRAAIDAYFGLETIVDDLSVISSPPRLDIARRQQLWHSDVEDLLTVKVYTFLTDVDASSGPLEYIAESHPKGRFAVPVAELWKRTFVKDPTPAHTFQVPDDLLFRHVRPDLLRILEGPAGTVVVFDARGIHRGGHVLQGIRQVAVSSHTAPNYAHPWRPPASRWGSIWSRFRWETNVKLKEPAPAPSAQRD